jgi:hypothetical protein
VIPRGGNRPIAQPVKRDMRRSLLALTMLLLAACAHTQGDGPSRMPGSGARGTVVFGPNCPVLVAGSPCPVRPWQGKVQAFTVRGAFVRDTTTDQGGAFELPLDPGTYDLIPLTPDGPPTAKMQRVRVTAGTFVSVTLQVDSGIR